MNAAFGGGLKGVRLEAPDRPDTWRMISPCGAGPARCFDQGSILRPRNSIVYFLLKYHRHLEFANSQTLMVTL